jgi:hypothetical protein
MKEYNNVMIKREYEKKKEEKDEVKMQISNSYFPNL